jgi:hypothetical protein
MHRKTIVGWTILVLGFIALGTVACGGGYLAHELWDWYSPSLNTYQIFLPTYTPATSHTLTPTPSPAPPHTPTATLSPTPTKPPTSTPVPTSTPAP